MFPLENVKLCAGTAARWVWSTQSVRREPVASTATDSDGMFRVSGLRGGRSYQVPAANAHWQSAPHSVALEVGASSATGAFACSGLAPGLYDCGVFDPADVSGEVVPVVLGEGAAQDVTLHVRPLATLRVAVQGTAQSGAPWAQVFARDPTRFPFQATPARGEFVFERLPLARYEVYIDQPSAGGAAAIVDLTHAGQVLTVELPAPARATIEGFVVDESGAPAVDTWVSASPTDFMARPVHATEPEALSNEAGAFTLSAVIGGVYDLRAENALGSAELLAVAAGATEVTLRVLTPRVLARLERPKEMLRD